MSGFSDDSEKAILDSATVGLGRTLYLALFRWSGTTGQGAGKTINDDGTLNSGEATNVREVTATGYARKQIASDYWLNATNIGYASKALASAVTWNAGAEAYGEICGWGLFTASAGVASGAASAAGLVCSGTLTNSIGQDSSVQVNANETFQFDSTNPIRVQLGDVGDSFV